MGSLVQMNWAKALVLAFLLLAAWLTVAQTIHSGRPVPSAAGLLERFGTEEAQDSAPVARDLHRVVVLDRLDIPLAEVTETNPWAVWPSHVPQGYQYSSAVMTGNSVSVYFADAAERHLLEITQIRLPVSDEAPLPQGHFAEIQVGDQSGVYVDGEWIWSESEDGSSLLPTEWRTDAGHSVIFDHSGVRVYVTDSSRALTQAELIQVASSIN